MFRIAKRKLFVFILLAICQCSLCYEAPANERPSPESSLSIEDEAMKFLRQYFYNAHRRDYSHISMNFSYWSGGKKIADRDYYIKVVEKLQYWIPEVYDAVKLTFLKAEILSSSTFRITYHLDGISWDIEVDNHGKYLMINSKTP